MKFLFLFLFVSISATREQAYVYAIGSASLVYTMAKACSSGNIPFCTCATEAEGTLPDEEFKWGGCADNVKWATKFGKRFIDTIERYHLKSIHHQNKHKLTERESMLHDKKFKKIKNYVSAMNLHNNRIGRKVNSKFYYSANLQLRFLAGTKFVYY